MASTHFNREGVAASARTVEVDGFRTQRIVAPSTPTQVAEALEDAARQGQAVTPIGSGSKLALGNVPERFDVALSTKGLDRVLHYEPDDLTLSVESGIKFSDVQSLLGERGQTLPVESPGEDDASIGGLIATALAGPRRLGNGTLRDLLIGISVAYPDGSIGKAGGLVVKNVTGFDLMRLHLGALGTLGVVVSANFKVLPAARHEATVLAHSDSFDGAASLARAAGEARLRPIAVEIFGSTAGWQVAARFEGRPQTVALGVGALQPSGMWEDRREGQESRDWWRAYVDRQRLDRAGARVLIRCVVAPKATSLVVPQLQAMLRAQDISPDYIAVSPALGVVVVELGREQQPIESLRPLLGELTRLCDAVTVLAAPAELKRDIDVWGSPPETIDVMRALKLEFDPRRVLNPGRFVDRI